MLGKLSVPSEVKVHNYVLKILSDGNAIKYIRTDSISNTEKCYILSRGIELRLVPIYPIFYPKFITQFILCEFEHEIVVAPGASVRLKIAIPVDLAVYAYSGNSFKIVDVLPLHRDVKYVLYGTTYSGTVARFCIAKFIDSVEEFCIGYALSIITIKNCMGRVARVRRILLDASPLRLYYREGAWRVTTQSISMNIVTETSAIVYYEKPIDPKAIPIDDPEHLRPPRIYNRTDMLQGY